MIVGMRVGFGPATSEFAVSFVLCNRTVSDLGSAGDDFAADSIAMTAAA